VLLAFTINYCWPGHSEKKECKKVNTKNSLLKLLVGIKWLFTQIQFHKFMKMVAISNPMIKGHANYTESCVLLSLSYTGKIHFCTFLSQRENFQMTAEIFHFLL
jgi:hypothetical protein